MSAEATAILDGGEQAPPANQAPPTNGSEPAAPTNGQPWYMHADYTDDDRQFIQNKGWHKNEAPVATNVLKSYRNLESIMAGKANAVILPKADDAKGMDELFTKLGRPEKPEEYRSALPAEKAGVFGAEEMALYEQVAHGARMTKGQFGEAMTKLAEVRAQAEEKADIAYNGEVVRTREKLQLEFGDQFGEQKARGDLAMRQAGLSRDDVVAIGSVIGVEKITRALITMGGALAQHKAIGLSNGGKAPDGFLTDKARAMERIQSIQRATSGPDFDFRTSMMDPSKPDHATTITQWREWQRIANSKG